MFCQKCGAEIMPGGVFCTKCGNKVPILSDIDPSAGEVKDPLTDAIRKFQKGDTSAFDTIYNESKRYIYYTILKTVSDKEIADDILQAVGNSEQPIFPQVVGNLDYEDLFAVPWGHHRVIIDRCRGDSAKASFFVRKTIQNNWSRAVLENFLDTDLYERL